VGQVSNRLKQVSALLTLLLAALLTGPLPGIEGGFGRSSSTALAELDVAQGATILGGKHSDRDAAGRHARDDSDAGDAAILAAFSAGTWSSPGRSPAGAGAAATTPPPARAYQARAPPTV
jgi:hypothetical protein